MQHPYSRQVLLNATRMAATFGAGFTTLWLFGRQGAVVQADYLILLGLRWVLSIPALGLESVAVPAMAAGRDDAVQRVAVWMCTALAALAVLGETVGPGHGLVLASGFYSASQVASSEPLARLLLEGQMGTHSALLAARRAADLVAALTAVALSGIGFEPFLSFLVILCALMLVHSMACHYFARAVQVRSEQGQFDIASATIAALIVAGAQVMALRVPVLVLGLTLPHALAIPASLAFVLGGYLRQAITVGIVGLDGLAARLGTDRQAHLARQAQLTVASLSFVAFAIMVAVSSWLIAQLLPPDVQEPPDMGLLLAVVLCGVLLRGLSDTWIKLANGQGRQAELLWPVAGHTFAMGLLMLAATITLAVEDMALAIGVIFFLGQGGLWFLLRPIARRKAGLSAPS